jgi:hypothetical protein
MELLGDVGHVESQFGPFRNSVSVGARQVQGLHQMYMGSETILGTPDAIARWRGSSGCLFQSISR